MNMLFDLPPLLSEGVLLTFGMHAFVLHGLEDVRHAAG